MPSIAFAIIGYGDTRNSKRQLCVSERTQIVIEGYPRSGNTFATCAFQFAQGGAEKVRIAHHLHSLANVIAGVRQGLPVVVVVRAPKDAIVSYKIRHPSRSLAMMIKEYILFHRYLERLRDNIEIATFSDVVKNFGEVTKRTNLRFGTRFVQFDGTSASVEAVFKMIDEANIITGGGDLMQVARPAKERIPVKQAVEKVLLENPRLAGELAVAQRIFEKLTCA